MYYKRNEGFSISPKIKILVNHEEGFSVLGQNKKTFDSYKEGTKNISYSLVVALDNEIYVATDSRSTTICGDNTFYNDNYQKIVIVPNTNIVLTSTGLNSFDKKTFEELVNSVVSVTQKEIFEELVLKVEKYETLKKMKTYISCISFFDKHIRIYRNNDNPIAYCDEVGCYSSGVMFANNITDNLNINILKDNPVKNIASLMKSIINISSFIDNTIGGPIQMVRITPEKAEWVEGYKPDFIKD